MIGEKRFDGGDCNMTETKRVSYHFANEERRSQPFEPYMSRIKSASRGNRTRDLPLTRQAGALPSDSQTVGK
jgi:hypothetical protein